VAEQASLSTFPRLLSLSFSTLDLYFPFVAWSASPTCLTRTIYTEPLRLHPNPILMQILIRSKLVPYDSVIIHAGEKIYFVLFPPRAFTKVLCFSYPILRTEKMNDALRMLLLPHRNYIHNEEY
jgi:hypothetical protein